MSSTVSKFRGTFICATFILAVSCAFASSSTHIRTSTSVMAADPVTPFPGSIAANDPVNPFPGSIAANDPVNPFPGSIAANDPVTPFPGSIS